MLFILEHQHRVKFRSFARDSLIRWAFKVAPVGLMKNTQIFMCMLFIDKSAECSFYVICSADDLKKVKLQVVNSK